MQQNIKKVIQLFKQRMNIILKNWNSNKFKNTSILLQFDCIN